MTSRGKYRTANLKTKVDVIREVEKGKKSKSEIAKLFGIPKNTLSTYLKNKKKILSEYEKGVFTLERKRLRKAAHPDLEDALVLWLKCARSKNIPVSGPLVKEKAEQLALRMGYETFRCSTGWIDRFKSRNNLVFRQVCGKSAATNVAITDEWKNTKLPELLAAYKQCDIFNADESGLFYKLLPDKTLTVKGDSCSGGKRNKERITVMVCANMDGTEKLPLLVIGKAKKPRAFKNIKSLPVEYTNNKNAWMTLQIFEAWLRKLDTKFAAKKRNVAIVVDNCSAHGNVHDLQAIKLVFLPPNTTAVLQPMDQGVIQNLKALYRKKLIQRILLCMSNGKDYVVDLLSALHLINGAWQAVSGSTVKGCFRHAGFRPTELAAAEETVGDLDDDDEDGAELFSELRQVGADIPFNVEFDEYANVDEGVDICEEMTDEAIISTIRGAEADEDEDDELDDDADVLVPLPAIPSAQEARQAVLTLRRFIESETDSENVFSSVSMLDNFVMQVSTKRLRQSRLTSHFAPARTLRV